MKQSSICSRGAGLSHPMDPAVSVRIEKLHKKPREACKSSLSPTGILKSFTQLVKISPGIIARLHHRSETDGIAHGPRLYVCQAPNAFICVSGLAPPKHQMRLYVCHQMRLYVCHQMRLYVCHQMRLYVCHQMRLYVCHQMCLLTQRCSLRSLTFARFARTFFNSLN